MHTEMVCMQIIHVHLYVYIYVCIYVLMYGCPVSLHVGAVDRAGMYWLSGNGRYEGEECCKS